jgi:hypothetical protein
MRRDERVGRDGRDERVERDGRDHAVAGRSTRAVRAASATVAGVSSLVVARRGKPSSTWRASALLLALSPVLVRGLGALDEPAAPPLSASPSLAVLVVFAVSIGLVAAGAVAHASVEAHGALWLLCLGVARVDPSASLLSTPIAAQVGGQGLLVLARVVLLLVALYAIPSGARRANASSWHAAHRPTLLVVALLVTLLASLVRQGFLIAFAAAVASTLAAARHRQIVLHERVLLALVPLSLVGGAALRPGPQAAPAEVARQRLDGNNPYGALPHALAAANAEDAPCEGALLLSVVLERLGDQASAARVRDDVVRQCPSDDVRGRARAGRP